MGIGDYMNQLSCLQPAYLGKHMEKDGILAYIPAVGCQHILGALILDTV